ncbi:hypothetical protein BH23ACT7_BH23ACT7_05360 [soil metagenome]|jgi:hypothetical protein
MVDATLLQPIITMNRAGLFHFDSHLRNLLTDGEQVLVTDLGLATARDFDLDEEERRFLDATCCTTPPTPSPSSSTASWPS